MDGGVNTLIWSVQQFNLAHYCKVAVFTIFTADYLHTLAAEINTLWSAPWTIVKIMFLISRYSPFVDGPAALAAIAVSASSVEVCTQLLKTNLWSCGIGQVCSHLLLIYRVYALCGRTRLSAVLLSFIAFALTTINFVFLPKIQRSIAVVGSSGLNIIPKCFIANADTITNRFIVVSTINIIICETILFGAMYWAKVKKYREDQNQLIRKIYNDAFMYYLLLLVISASGVILWFATTGPIRDLSSSMPRYLVSMISCRIILNIRKYANGHHTSEEVGATGMGGTTRTISGLRFASDDRGSGIDTDLRLQ